MQFPPIDPAKICGYVYKTDTGEPVAWFSEPAEAQDFVQRINRKRGKNSHDWQPTMVRFANRPV